MTKRIHYIDYESIFFNLANSSLGQILFINNEQHGYKTDSSTWTTI